MNYYTQFAVAFPVNPTEALWLVTEQRQRALNTEQEQAEFNWDGVSLEASRGICSIVGDSDTANTEVVVALLTDFTAAFPDHAPVTFECAYAASRPVAGAFGGSAFTFYKGRCHFISTADIIGQHLDAITLDEQAWLDSANL